MFLKPAAAAQGTLAEAERLRRHLEQLVLADPLQALLEVHHARGCQLDALVRRGGPHVGELLLFGDVDVEVDITKEKKLTNMRASTSNEEARMLVSFFSLVMLTSRSLSTSPK